MRDHFRTVTLVPQKIKQVSIISLCKLGGIVPKIGREFTANGNAVAPQNDLLKGPRFVDGFFRRKRGARNKFKGGDSQEGILGQ